MHEYLPPAHGLACELSPQSDEASALGEPMMQTVLEVVGRSLLPPRSHRLAAQTGQRPEHQHRLSHVLEIYKTQVTTLYICKGLTHITKRKGRLIWTPADCPNLGGHTKIEPSGHRRF